MCQVLSFLRFFRKKMPTWLLAGSRIIAEGTGESQAEIVINCPEQKRKKDLCLEVLNLHFEVLGILKVDLQMSI